MICAWKDLLAVLPLWIRRNMDMQEPDCLREIRLRINSPPELVFPGKSRYLPGSVAREDLDFVVNAASRYSPWTAATSARGFLTLKGGHRMGLCGEAVSRSDRVHGLGKLTSLCIRVAGDYPGIASGLESVRESLLILGPPGWGKTTLLRDLIRRISEQETVGVVDERGELFPPQLPAGKKVDVLSGCSKQQGISMLLRTMGPDTIAVDEITDPEDVQTLLEAANCGVRLVATAHAGSLSDYRSRCVYQPLVENGIFHSFVVLKRNNTYTLERMDKWNTDWLERA